MRLWRLRGFGARFGLTVAALWVLAAAAAPLLAPSSPKAIDLMADLQRPSARHWLGTGENCFEVVGNQQAIRLCGQQRETAPDKRRDFHPLGIVGSLLERMEQRRG